MSTELNGLERRLPIVSAVLAGLGVALVAWNATAILGNQAAEQEVQQRQQVINRSLQVNQISTALLQLLGQAAVGGDEAIKNLLAEFGVNVTPNAAPAPAAKPAAPAAGTP